MKSPAGFHPFAAWLFVFFACLSMLGMQVFAQAPLGQNAPPAEAPRRALERRGLQAETILRVLELPAVQKALILSDEQREKIEDISFNVRRAAIQQLAELRVQRMELERLMRADTSDRAAIDKKTQEVAQAQTAILRARVNALMDLRGILSKDQREKIRESIVRRIQQGARAKIQQAQPGQRPAPPIPPVPPTPPNPPAPR